MIRERLEMQHQSSRLGYDDNRRSGFKWRVLHLLDFHQRFHMRKVLGYVRHRDRKHAGRVKLPELKSSVPSADEEHDFLGRDLVEDQVIAANRSAGKACMGILIPKRRTRKQDQKRGISPLASCLLRTISIHHRECHDYVVPDHIVSDTDHSTFGFNTHASGSSPGTEHMPLLHPAHDVPILQKRCGVCGTVNTVNFMDLNQLNDLGNHLLRNQSLLREELNEAKDALLKQKRTEEQGGDIAVNQSKFFSDMMLLLNGNEELFLKVLQEPIFGIANYLQNQPASSSDVTLTRYGSFPGAGSRGRKDGRAFRIGHKKYGSEPQSFVNQEQKSQAGNSPSVPNIDDAQAAQPIISSHAGISETEPTTLHSSATTNSEFLPGSPSELKHQRHDGPVLSRFKDIKHKIKDIIKENMKEKHRISMDGILHKIPYGHKLSKGAKKEEPCLSEGSERHPWRDKYANQGIRRSRTFAESFDRYSHLLHISSSNGPKNLLGKLTLLQRDDDFQSTRHPKTLGRIFSLPELESYFSSRNDQGEAPGAALSEKIPTVDLQDCAVIVETLDFDEPNRGGILVHKEGRMGSDFELEHAADMNTSMLPHRDSEQKELINEHEQCETCIIEATNSSTVSILDSIIQEDPVSLPRYPVSEGSELEPRFVHFEETGPLIKPPSELSVDASNVKENIKIGLSKIQSLVGVADISTFNIQVDQKDEAEFNLVKEVLIKSRFDDRELYREWWQTSRLADTLLFEESEGFSHELDCVDNEHVMPPDHQLLFDLINEILLEMYDAPHAYCPWLSRSSFCLRSMPTGYRLLEKVWASIRWHLNSQEHCDPTIDYLVARDLGKNDRWMNLQCDTKYAGLELEDMILDDVVDEVILQFCGGSS